MEAWKEPSVKIFNSDKPAASTAMIVVCLMGLFAGSRAVAAESAKPPASGDGNQKIHITAQQLVSDTANNQAEFIGDVHATQGETEISADRLKIYFSGKPDAENGSATQSLEKLVATGNVEIKFDNRLAVARQAVYITADRTLTLTGPGATVTSGENTISGDKITYYRASGRFTVDGGAGGRVKAVILPESSSGLE